MVSTAQNQLQITSFARVTVSDFFQESVYILACSRASRISLHYQHACASPLSLPLHQWQRQGAHPPRQTPRWRRRRSPGNQRRSLRRAARMWSLDRASIWTCTTIAGIRCVGVGWGRPRGGVTGRGLRWQRASALLILPSPLNHHSPPRSTHPNAPQNPAHQIWGAGLQPGQRFDAGKPPPLLPHLLSTSAPVAGRRALVPGCGRGYDVLAAAAAGAALAVGIDISEDAIRSAEEHRDATVIAEVAARARFERADFFSYKHAGGPFDVGCVVREAGVVGGMSGACFCLWLRVSTAGCSDAEPTSTSHRFDYTFLCALPPTNIRKQWAEGWARNLAPGGRLWLGQWQRTSS